MYLLLLSAGLGQGEDLPLLGLAHVGIRVADLDKARAFYHGVLGYEEAFDVYKGESKDVAVAFFKINDQQYIELVPGLPADQVAPMPHIAMLTDNITKLHAMLEERGLKVGPINKGPRDGNLSCAIRELPGQNLKFLEFVQYQPDSLHSRAVGKALGANRISIRLEHAGIIATNYEAAWHFYVDKLRFRESWSRKQANGQPFLTHLNLPGASGDFVELSNKPKSITRQAAGMAAHFSLTVPDIKVAYRQALERGAKGIKEPRFGLDKRWQFNLFDPDGTRAECMQPESPDGKP